MTTRKIVNRLLCILVTPKRIAFKDRMKSSFMLRDVKRANAAFVFVAVPHGDFSRQNDERMHHYQRRRAPITRLVL